ncbi:CDC27 family protein [uncultured Salinisphaera sp.]|uniref:CDC27 family protein n=1 Tax=uncultured Salinisphaera sp. TaxID=359372 RepID=UPI0032B12901|tara:strand:- start:2759 stop:3103 length:345 start_codon:yes stop_codon:yes gene_type:complete
MRDQLQAMIDAGRDTPLARFTLGELLHREGDYSTAIDHLAEAVRQDPSYSAAWKLYGRVLLDAERYREAVDVLARGVEIAQDKGDNQAAREMQVFAKRAAKQVDATPGGSGQSD